MTDRPIPTVLLIEDEPEIRRFLRTTLPEHGFRLYEAVTGNEGLAEAQARNPDLMLLDLGLPDMDGLQIIKNLRERYAGNVMTHRRTSATSSRNWEWATDSRRSDGRRSRSR